MFELLIAFVLYQFNASAGWWYAFVAILVVDFMFAIYRGYTDNYYDEYDE